MNRMLEEWEEVGCSSFVKALEWLSYRFFPDGAKPWIEHDFSPQEAATWHRYGFTPQEADEWRSQGVSASNARILTDYH